MKLTGNPFFWAGIIIFGNFLFNFVFHELFEEHPFFSDLETHFYHVYFAIIGFAFLLFYVAIYLKNKSK